MSAFRFVLSLLLMCSFGASAGDGNDRDLRFVEVTEGRVRLIASVEFGQGHYVENSHRPGKIMATCNDDLEFICIGAPAVGLMFSIPKIPVREISKWQFFGYEFEITQIMPHAGDVIVTSDAKLKTRFISAGKAVDFSLIPQVSYLYSEKNGLLGWSYIDEEGQRFSWQVVPGGEWKDWMQKLPDCLRFDEGDVRTLSSPTLSVSDLIEALYVLDVGVRCGDPSESLWPASSRSKNKKDGA